MSDREEATSFVIEQRDKIEIYTGDKGHVVLKQDSYTGEESVIWIHPDDVAAVIRYLEAARTEAYEIRKQGAGDA
ncbi:hypothetical protein [Stenotrophomonas sp. Iso1]|uniref:hypothetical protein n=1 Tax=Stenotrophomonas sp. Iso1 TaxID=2977283 RepID=UPI0022B78B5A|nr:hypothetical protein [Stenotrophomonas sp. Iso1]